MSDGSLACGRTDTHTEELLHEIIDLLKEIKEVMPAVQRFSFGKIGEEA